MFRFSYNLDGWKLYFAVKDREIFLSRFGGFNRTD